MVNGILSRIAEANAATHIVTIQHKSISCFAKPVRDVAIKSSTPLYFSPPTVTKSPEKNINILTSTLEIVSSMLYFVNINPIAAPVIAINEGLI